MNYSHRSPKGNRHMRRVLNQTANAAARTKGSIFELVYRRSYGCKWWLFKLPDSTEHVLMARGFGGQDLMVFPKEGLIVTVTMWDILPRSDPAEASIENLAKARASKNWWWNGCSVKSRAHLTRPASEAGRGRLGGLP